MSPPRGIARSTVREQPGSNCCRGNWSPTRGSGDPCAASLRAAPGQPPTPDLVIRSRPSSHSPPRPLKSFQSQQMSRRYRRRASSLRWLPGLPPAREGSYSPVGIVLRDRRGEHTSELQPTEGTVLMSRKDSVRRSGLLVPLTAVAFGLLLSLDASPLSAQADDPGMRGGSSGTRSRSTRVSTRRP